jgi:hypothetical protein
MADYNIIYIAADDQHYLWDGSGFSPVNNKENEKLMFSGKSYNDQELPDALKQCREAVNRTFPSDTSPQIKHVEVPVNSKDEEHGHSSHILS